MSERSIAFKRMVLRFPHSPGDYAAVTVTAKLAELLRIDLVVALVEDATLIDIAGMPGVRELRPLEGGWRPMVAAELRARSSTWRGRRADCSPKRCGPAASRRI